MFRVPENTDVKSEEQSREYVLGGSLYSIPWGLRREVGDSI